MKELSQKPKKKTETKKSERFLSFKELHLCELIIFVFIMRCRKGFQDETSQMPPSELQHTVGGFDLMDTNRKMIVNTDYIQSTISLDLLFAVTS